MRLAVAGRSGLLGAVFFFKVRPTVGFILAVSASN